MAIYAALTDMTPADVLREHGGSQFSGFKAALVDVAVTKLAPIADEMRRLMADPGHIDAVLADGSARARVIARRDHGRRQGHRRLRARALSDRFN